MDNPAHIILRLRDEARRKQTAALERAEKAQREAEKHAVEADAYDKALAAVSGQSPSGNVLPSKAREQTAPRPAGASEKWIEIYRALHESANPPFSYEDLSAAVSRAGHEASAGGQRTQMMNAVKAGWFNRVGHGKFEFTGSGLALIGADQNENEPPLGGSETGEVTASLDMQSETSQGLPSAHSPDPAGQTRHWKLPGG